MVSFASSSASLNISMISEVECFFFPLLTWAGSSLLLTSSIFKVLARVLVRGHWGGLWGQSRLRCPCFLQVKHLPAFISSVLSLSRDDDSWLDSTWVCCSWRRALYRSLIFARLRLAGLRCSRSLAQTTVCCVFVPSRGQIFRVRWALVRSYSWTKTSLCPGASPEAHSWVEISLREWNVVVVQEIEPKVRFLKLQGLYTFKRSL